MNFLAHCSLAHDAAATWQCTAEQRAGLLAGAVIGDFVKGRIPQHWPQPLQAGARLHRKVDALSNQSPGIRQNCARFPDHLRRFAPIFVDMLADHALALGWHEYYEVDRYAFSADCYAAIAAYEEYLPANATRFYAYMCDVDLLANYDDWQNVARGLESVLRRLGRDDWYQEVEAASRRVMADAHVDFGGYYPELRQAWSSWDAFAAIAARQS